MFDFDLVHFVHLVFVVVVSESGSVWGQVVNMVQFVPMMVVVLKLRWMSVVELKVVVVVVTVVVVARHQIANLAPFADVVVPIVVVVRHQTAASAAVNLVPFVVVVSVRFV